MEYIRRSYTYGTISRFRQFDMGDCACFLYWIDLRQYFFHLFFSQGLQTNHEKANEDSDLIIMGVAGELYFRCLWG